MRLPDTKKSRDIASTAFLFASVGFTLLICGVQAQSASGSRSEGFAEVETRWPGVHFQLFRIERNPLNRLVVAVRIVATDKAPRSGTFLGTQTPIPAGASRDEMRSGLYDPKPFSLAGSEMTDDQTGQKYPVLPPLAPAGRKYLPATTLTSLMPGQAELLTIQFAIPPSPPGDAPGRQTATFLFPNAKGPIMKVPVPPPTLVDDSGGQNR